MYSPRLSIHLRSGLPPWRDVPMDLSAGMAERLWPRVLHEQPNQRICGVQTSSYRLGEASAGKSFLLHSKNEASYMLGS